jgi:hypothetical protein
LLLTLLLIFAFQAENLTTRWFAVVLIAVPVLNQVYFNSSLICLLMRKFTPSSPFAATRTRRARFSPARQTAITGRSLTRPRPPVMKKKSSPASAVSATKCAACLRPTRQG